MANSKVIFGDTVVMDITDSTVTPQALLDSVVRYNAAGERIVGKVVVPVVDDTLQQPGAAADAFEVGKRFGGIEFVMVDNEPHIVL